MRGVPNPPPFRASHAGGDCLSGSIDCVAPAPPARPCMTSAPQVRAVAAQPEYVRCTDINHAKNLHDQFGGRRD